ncbi:MAG: hypothetical protein MK185_06560 [Saccharospirillaceae bacterium]|nr:hypothetical protein [Saccharospirillaceae bacterium]
MGIKAKIASLVVSLHANSATFNNELKKSKKETHQWAKEVKGYAKVGAGAIAASAVAAAGGLTVLTNRAFDNIDALAKHSDKIGSTTKALAGLRHQGELNGVAQRALDVGLQRSTRRISEAAKGTSVASAALAELGLNAQELNKLSPDQQFYRIADAMEGIENQTDKVRLGFKLFDSEGVGLINAMRGGSEELAKAAREAEQLGVAVNRVDAAKIEAANDASYKAGMAMQGLGNTIAIKVAPLITILKTEFVEAAKENNGFRDQVNAGMKIVVKAVGFAGNAVRGMQLVWKGAQLLVATFTATTLQNLETIAQKVVSVANILPGINVKLDENSGISGLAKASAAHVAVLKEELHELAMKKLPSEGVQEWFDEVQAKAEAAGKQIAAANKPTVASASIESVDFSTGSEAEKVAAELNRGNEHFIAAYERRQEIIDNALAAKQVSEERHFEISKSNWTKYQQAIADSEAQTRAANIAGGKTFFANLATLTKAGSSRLAKIGRAAARINIAISTSEAAMSSYKWAASWGGPAAGALAASAAVAAGLVRMRELNKGTISQGGSGGGLSGQTTFDQALPNSAATISSVPDSALRRTQENRPHIENYYAQGAIQAIDTQSFDDRIRDSRQAVAEATEEHLQEYGHSLTGS